MDTILSHHLFTYYILKWDMVIISAISPFPLTRWNDVYVNDVYMNDVYGNDVYMNDVYVNDVYMVAEFMINAE